MKWTMGGYASDDLLRRRVLAAKLRGRTDRAQRHRPVVP